MKRVRVTKMVCLAAVLCLAAVAAPAQTQVAVTPSSLRFADQAVDTTSKPKSVTLKDTGTATLDISNIAITLGTNFAVSSNTCGATLAVKKTCKVSVTFTPTALGTLTDTLTFTDNATGSPQTVSLSGTGEVQATLTPASRTFPKTEVGTTSAAHIFTLKNDLPTALTSISYLTTGPFAVSASTCETSLDSKKSCTISVTFSPMETGTATGTLEVTDSASNSPQTVNLAGTGKPGPLAIVTTSCPDGTQGAAYSGCTIVARGGNPPYTYSVSMNSSVPPLPEGMSINAATGAVSSSLIGGQGTYIPEFVVTDSASNQVAQNISIAIAGSNAFLATIFPSDSIFHHRVDAATTGLPVDTSPAAPINSNYLSAKVQPFFGTEVDSFPNGIPAISVPYNQPLVAVTTTKYQSYFTSAPIPSYAPVEGTSASNGDRHVLVYQQAGGGQTPALYEMWEGIYEGGPWTCSSNALWPDVTSDALTPQGDGTADAAGLPIAPLLVNADEVIGSGTPSAPAGTIQHPIRFTIEHMLNYWVWPGTTSAGQGNCTASGGNSIPTSSEIYQSSPPQSCSWSGPAGEIYRLKASVATPSCASTSPQAAIIITALRNYGIILADNGASGGLIGTPDARWDNNDLSCLTSLTLANFEPVNVSSLMVSNDSGATSH